MTQNSLRVAATEKIKACKTYYRAFINDRTEKAKDGCWLWTGGHDSCGYGKISVWVDGYVFGFKAHRVAAYFDGLCEIDTDRCVLHHCDTPNCVAPEHLFVGSKGDNNRDCASKARTVNQYGAAKLNPNMVRFIRSAYTKGFSTRALAKRFRVCRGCIYHVISRKSWRHVAVMVMLFTLLPYNVKAQVERRDISCYVLSPNPDSQCVKVWEVRRLIDSALVKHRLVGMWAYMGGEWMRVDEPRPDSVMVVDTLWVVLQRNIRDTTKMYIAHRLPDQIHEVYRIDTTYAPTDTAAFRRRLKARMETKP